MSDERNLLITIIDTNPVWWGLQGAGLVNSDSSSANLTNPLNNFSFSDYLSAVVGFLNAYRIMNQQNNVVLIAAHNNKADFLYPNRAKYSERYSSPWDQFENISDMDEQIKENLKNFIKDQAVSLSAEGEKDRELVLNDSMISSALGLGLCYINRIQKKYTFVDTVKFRFLVIKASDDSSNQYMNFMNMIFTAEKLNIMIDSCVLSQDSSLLQQASNLTNGFYFKVPQIHGLLNYLLWIFLANESTRQMLVYPPKSQVDYRAACFCHRTLIDVGYVCSVCLSVFCSFTPICTTCNCNFQFDMSMLKKASLIKQRLQHQSGQSSSDSFSSSNGAARLTDDFHAKSLVSQFQDTSISSPSAPLNTANSNSNFNDSFDMLE